MAKNKGQNSPNMQPEPAAPLTTESAQQSQMNQANRQGAKKNPSPQNRGGQNAR